VWLSSFDWAISSKLSGPGSLRELPKIKDFMREETKGEPDLGAGYNPARC